VGYEAKRPDPGERLIWLEPVWVDKLAAPHGPGASYGEVVLRPQRKPEPDGPRLSCLPVLGCRMLAERG
jgi:hypothetical protein